MTETDCREIQFGTTEHKIIRVEAIRRTHPNCLEGMIRATFESGQFYEGGADDLKLRVGDIFVESWWTKGSNAEKRTNHGR